MLLEEPNGKIGNSVSDSCKRIQLTSIQIKAPLRTTLAVLRVLLKVVLIDIVEPVISLSEVHALTLDVAAGM